MGVPWRGTGGWSDRATAVWWGLAVARLFVAVDAGERELVSGGLLLRGGLGCGVRGGGLALEGYDAFGLGGGAHWVTAGRGRARQVSAWA